MQRRTVSQGSWITASLIVLTGVGSSCADDSDPSSPTPNTDSPRTDSRAEVKVNDPDTNKQPRDTSVVPGESSSVALNDVPEGFMEDAGDGWKTLVTGHWELDGGQETYRCVRFTLPEDVSIAALRAISPAGTHHTVLSIADEDEGLADGTTDCEATTNGKRSLLATGVGSNAFTLPDGIGMRLHAGQQLLLNLHLFNVNDAQLKGMSGTLVRTIADAEIKQRAEFFLAGPVDLDLPARERTTAAGPCTITQDGTLFAVFPHMHQLGVHLKAVAHSSVDGEIVLHDGPYDFEDQLTYPLEQPIQVRAGDRIDIECTYENTTDQPVMWGDSSLAEMCFAGLYRYPATDSSYLCLD